MMALDARDRPDSAESSLPLTAESHRHCDLPGTGRRRAARLCRGNGRFPDTGMTGGPARIIASANGWGSGDYPAEE